VKPAEESAANAAANSAQTATGPQLRASNPVLRAGRRIGVATVGGTVTAVGVALLVLPGPGLLVVIAGLAILATEFAWAQRRLDQAQKAAKKTGQAAKTLVKKRGQKSTTAEDNTVNTEGPNREMPH
jgi:uncharacterized protein (TIGR02611 family)